MPRPIGRRTQRVNRAIFSDQTRSGGVKGASIEPSADSPASSKKAQINHAVPVPGGTPPVTYFVSAPHPPSERLTDAGQLPPWLLGVAFSTRRVRPARETNP
ncbi:hypothetical protein GCM10018772_64410 [Streptomyces fumanus]|uniref:Uncharacterized protein n=1 Tax=Streptomyces fumanus TaxID=67302 RepID=A0A919AYN6_9ACTN|nr:hypothetical protein GCM10018772_64410 [Streptomyces fumanus]